MPFGGSVGALRWNPTASVIERLSTYGCPLVYSRAAFANKSRKLCHCPVSASTVPQSQPTAATQTARGRSRSRALQWHKPFRHSKRAYITCRSTVEQYMQGQSDPVVSTAWLAEHTQDVAILDVRGTVKTQLRSTNSQGCRLEMSEYIADYDTYLEGHIPGATFFDWTKDGVDEDQDIPVQLQTDSDTFAAEMEAKGVGTDRPVVVYDSGNGLLAPRIWWCLMYHSYPAPLIMDGGYAKWVEEGRPTDLAEPCPLTASPDVQQWHTGCKTAQQPKLQAQEPALSDAQSQSQRVYASFQPKAQPHKRATCSDMLKALDAQEHGTDLVILDARGREQYTGQVKRAERGGHIPGAVNISRKSLLDKSTGLLRPLQDQREVFQQAGVDCSGKGSQQIYTYCNGGVASCSLALALHRLGLGEQTANYDGSWNEWGNELQLPVTTGDA